MRKCPVCDKEVVGDPRKVYCSKNHQSIASYRRAHGIPIGDVKRRCPVCSVEFSGKAHKVYCTRGCKKLARVRRENQKPIENPEGRLCPRCDSPVQGTVRRVYCSATCKRKVSKIRSRARRRAKYVGTFSAQDWQSILEANDHECYLCGEIVDFHVEHVIPISRGGTSWPHNLLPSCGPCNFSKGQKSVVSFYNKTADFVYDALKDPHWFNQIKEAYDNYMQQDNAEEALVREWLDTLNEMERVASELEALKV